MKTIISLFFLISIATQAYAQDTIEDVTNEVEKKSTTKPVTEAPDAAAAPKAPKAAATPAPDRGIRFELSGGVHSGRQMKFKSVTDTSGNGGDYSADTQEAVEVSAKGMMANQDAWGFQAGITIQSAREISNDTLTIAGSPNSTTYTDKPKIQFTLIEANALYRWKQFYLPFGLNISSPSYTATPGSAQLDVKGGLGVQFGMGYFLNDNWHLEFISKTIAMKAKTSSGTSYDFGTGTLSGISLTVGYLFD